METTSRASAPRSSEESTAGGHRVVFSDPEALNAAAVRDQDPAPVPAVFSSHY
ncbi:hypothetical protein [Arthrobacter sp. PsM3]|uniref:hypothetical protein n=1 Tax=Arthrobacter sp. PsM3 TaxID=3030531 RepID=UPI00263B127C|nr:hypothetical protein [Arthrobacter sp. PsM3]MDN4646172.1 hypothetical protein [Arthrobacter sp. PsM3]